MCNSSDPSSDGWSCMCHLETPEDREREEPYREPVTVPDTGLTEWDNDRLRDEDDLP